MTKDRNELAKQVNFLQSFQGIEHVEIWLERGDWNRDDMFWLKEQLQELACIVHAPFVSMYLVGDHPLVLQASVESLKRSLDLSVSLGAKVFTIHIGRPPTYMSDEESFEISKPYLKELLEYAGDTITVSIENLPQQKGASRRFPVMLKHIEAYLADFPSLSATVDIGHCILNRDPYNWFFRKHSDRIADIHLHNANQEKKEHYSIAEQGDVDIKLLLSLLDDINYTHFVSLEVFKDHELKESWGVLHDYLMRKI